MFKKLIWIMLLVLAGFGLISGEANAQVKRGRKAQTDEYYRTVQFEGSIAAVDPGDGMFDLILDESSNDLTAIFVNENTKFKGILTGLEDLNADMNLSIWAVSGSDGLWYAVSIIAESPKIVFENENSTSTSTSSSSLSVEPKHTDGEHGSGEYENNTSPKPNSGNTNNGDDGDYFSEIYTGKPKLNSVGRVTAVGSETLTIQTNDGTPRTFSVDDKTLWNSYWSEQDSLSEIGLNYKVSVIYIEGDTYLGLQRAYRLAILNGGTAFNPHQQGWVQSVSPNEMTIKTNQGAVYSFEIESYTNVKGVGSYSEIAPGMRVFVYYKDMGTELCAVGIQVWP